MTGALAGLLDDPVALIGQTWVAVAADQVAGHVTRAEQAAAALCARERTLFASWLPG